MGEGMCSAAGAGRWGGGSRTLSSRLEPAWLGVRGGAPWRGSCLEIVGMVDQWLLLLLLLQAAWGEGVCRRGILRGI